MPSFVQVPCGLSKKNAAAMPPMTMAAPMLFQNEAANFTHGLPCDPPLGGHVHAMAEDDITPGRAALRKFKLAYVGSGSRAAVRATRLRSSLPSCARSRHHSPSLVLKMRVGDDKYNTR
jgi:hypothetical protein